MSKSQALMQIVRDNPLPWVVQVFASIFFIGNLYMATQLFPLVRNIDSVVSRVNAVETELNTRRPLDIRFIQLEERDKLLVEDIKDIKTEIKELGKVHGLLFSNGD